MKRYFRHKDHAPERGYYVYETDTRRLEFHYLARDGSLDRVQVIDEQYPSLSYMTHGGDFVEMQGPESDLRVSEGL